MRFKHKPPFNKGFTMLVPRSGATADMLMDFGVLALSDGDDWEDIDDTDERVYLLSKGSAKIAYSREGEGEGASFDVSRASLFDESPWCLSVPAGTGVSITAGKDGCEWYYCATENAKDFAPKMFTPEDCRSELRGEGTMNETSTRVVRTCFDDTTRPESNLVIGEVIGVPGKWSSYPPHHHPQPEIYHYRFLPEQGFGLTAIGETPYILRERDTVCIREGEVHPHVTAPGYAMWYLWVIRHIEGAHYGPATNTPIFVDEHKWVTGPQEKIWQPKR
jgi:5-deoxy-glucuronate isomerase